MEGICGSLGRLGKDMILRDSRWDVRVGRSVLAVRVLGL